MRLRQKLRKAISHIAYLQLGSNLGDRQSYLTKSVRLLLSKGITLIEQSSVYETAAWGNEDVPSYYNQILKVSTELSPHTLLDTCLDVERILGRKREEKWASRCIDIDIIYYSNWLILSQELKVPHPYRAERKFITTMLNEINPMMKDPVFDITLQEMNENCKDILEVSLIS